MESVSIIDKFLIQLSDKLLSFLISSLTHLLFRRYLIRFFFFFDAAVELSSTVAGAGPCVAVANPVPGGSVAAEREFRGPPSTEDDSDSVTLSAAVGSSKITASGSP